MKHVTFSIYCSLVALTCLIILFQLSILENPVLFPLLVTLTVFSGSLPAVLLLFRTADLSDSQASKVSQLEKRILELERRDVIERLEEADKEKS